MKLKTLTTDAGRLFTKNVFRTIELTEKVKHYEEPGSLAQILLVPTISADFQNSQEVNLSIKAILLCGRH